MPRWVSAESMEGEGEKKKRRRRDRRNRERETEGEGLRVRKRVASGRGAPRRSREERACAPVLSGAHLSVSPGTCTRRIGTHFCVCAHLRRLVWYTSVAHVRSWRAGTGELEGGRERCDPASENEGKSVFWKRSTVSATKRKRGERRSVPSDVITRR